MSMYHLLRMARLRAAALVLCLLSSCVAIGAAIGGIAGSPLGPGGVLAGSVAGAEAGDIVAAKKRAEAQSKKDDERIAVLDSRIIELEATIKANNAIDDHNSHLTGKETPVRHVNPIPVDGDKSHLYVWLAALAVLAVIGGTAAYVFRRPLRAWFATQWSRLPGLWSAATRALAKLLHRSPKAPTEPTTPTKETSREESKEGI